MYNGLKANFFEENAKRRYIILILIKHNNEFNFKIIKYFILLRVILESKFQRGEKKFVIFVCFALF